jgi:hypothetical protein
MVSRIAYFLTQSGAIVAILGTLAFAAGNVYEYYKEKRLYQLDMGFARGPRGKFTKIVSFKK